MIMATIEERIQKLEDESAVRNLAARFADAGIRGDFEEFESLWVRFRAEISNKFS